MGFGESLLLQSNGGEIFLVVVALEGRGAIFLFWSEILLMLQSSGGEIFHLVAKFSLL